MIRRRSRNTSRNRRSRGSSTSINSSKARSGSGIKQALNKILLRITILYIHKHYTNWIGNEKTRQCTWHQNSWTNDNINITLLKLIL